MEAKQSGVISRSELYTLPEFKKRMGLSESAMRQLRRKGLRVLRIGKRAFVHGGDAIEHLQKLGGGDGQRQSRQ